MEISFHALRKIQVSERESTQLTEIPPDFYQLVGEHFEKLRQEILAEDILSPKREPLVRNYHNLIKIVQGIRKQRVAKIVMLVVSNAPLSGALRKRMTPEEETLYQKLVSVLEENERHFEQLMKYAKESHGEGRVSSDKDVSPSLSQSDSFISDSQKEEKAEGIKSIRILKDIPKFIGYDMRSYGPYKAGEEISLPEKIGDVLVKRNLAEVKK